MCVDLKWSYFNSERMELLISQRWFCSVASPCITEAIHWSQPSHKEEKLLFWKFGVSAFCLCKVILKTSSVANRKRLQCLCCQPTIYCRFVDILSRYDLFWWLIPEKIAFCFFCFLGQNIDISFGPNGAQLSARWWFTLRAASRSYYLHLMTHYPVKARNWAVSTKQSISPSTRWRGKLNNFPLHTLIFARLVPRKHVAFSSEPLSNLLCTTILDIISTSCAYVHSLQHACSPARHAARDRARAAAGPSTFWRLASQWVPLRATVWSF